MSDVDCAPTVCQALTHQAFPEPPPLVRGHERALGGGVGGGGGGEMNGDDAEGCRPQKTER